MHKYYAIPIISLLVSSCSFVSYEKNVSSAQINYIPIEWNIQCSGSGLTFLAVESKGSRSYEVDHFPFYLPSGTYIFYYRPARLKMVDGECKLLEQITTHVKYMAEQVEGTVTAGRSYSLEGNIEGKVSLNTLQ
jgi:hypothetical protein